VKAVAVPSVLKNGSPRGQQPSEQLPQAQTPTANQLRESSRSRKPDDDDEEEYLNVSSKISLDGKLDYASARSKDNSVSEKRSDNSRSELQIIEIDDVPGSPTN